MARADVQVVLTSTGMLAILAALALSATASHALPDLLWDNGEWDRAKAVSSERNTLVPDSWIVDDFFVADAVAVRDIEWLSVRSAGFDPIGADLLILTSAFAPVTEMTDLPYASEFVDMYQGLEVHRLLLHDLGVHLDPGRYYIGVRSVGNGDFRAFSALQDSIHGATEAFFRSEHFGYPDWVSTGEVVGPRDAVFRVFGDIVPAPATLVLGLPALLAWRRRR